MSSVNDHLRAMLDELAKMQPHRPTVLEHLTYLADQVGNDQALPEVDTAHPHGTYEVRGR